MVHCIGVNHPAIVREIPHFDVFPAFLLERPAFFTNFEKKNFDTFPRQEEFFYVFLGSHYQIFVDTISIFRRDPALLITISIQRSPGARQLVEHLADSTRWRIYPLGDVVIKVVSKVLSVNNAK